MAEAKAWVMIPKLDEDKTGCVLDMRPLVTCQDCKYNKHYACGKEPLYGCENGPGLHEPYWFCADGKLDETLQLTEAWLNGIWSAGEG